jgi:segregation and condensation protein A
MADEVPVATAEGGEDAGGTAYAVTVEAFSGPLDLLLYLVRRTELDITEIPIAEIADQFVETVRGWHERGELDLEMAGDFVLMAATLLEIKARTIAPPPEEEGAGDDDDDDLVDPRADLIAKLLAYRRFKEATAHLQRLQAERQERAVRRFKEEIPEDPEEVEGLDLGELDPHALWKCWNVIVTRLGGMGPRTVAKDDIPIEARVGSVIEFGREQRRTTLRQLLARESTHLGRVTTLMATLEVVRQRWLEARQWEQFGDVDLRFREAEEREAKPVLPEPEPDDGKKRRRRPPLSTWTPPPTAAPVEGEAPGEGEDGEVENFESDEERFLRELNEACALDRVLRDAKDWEGGFRRHWEVLHPPPPPPPMPDPPPVPVVEPAPAAAEVAAETPAKPKRVPPWLRKKAEAPAEPAAPALVPAVVELPVVARAALQRVVPQAEALVEPPAPVAPVLAELPVVARSLLEPVAKPVQTAGLEPGGPREEAPAVALPAEVPRAEEPAVAPPEAPLGSSPAASSDEVTMAPEAVAPIESAVVESAQIAGLEPGGPREEVPAASLPVEVPRAEEPAVASPPPEAPLGAPGSSPAVSSDEVAVAPEVVAPVEPAVVESAQIAGLEPGGPREEFGKPSWQAEPPTDPGESWDDDSGEPPAPVEVPVVQAPVVPPPVAAASAPAPFPVSGNARPSPWPLVFAAGLTAAMIGAWLALRPARPAPPSWPAPLPPLGAAVLVVDAPAAPDAQPAAFPALPTVAELATLGLPAWFDAPVPVVVPWDAFLPPAPAAPPLPQLGQGRSLARVLVAELGRPGGWTLALTVAPVSAAKVLVVPWDAFLPPAPPAPALWWLGCGPGLTAISIEELGRPGGWTRALVAGSALVAVVPWDAWLPAVPSMAPGLDAWAWLDAEDLRHWARPGAWRAGQVR